MPWKRNDPPDPLEARRRQLEEQQRNLVEQRKRLTEQLHQSADSSAGGSKPTIHPVWRMEDEAHYVRPADPTPVRKKHLAHQRRRDMWFVMILVAFLLVILMIVLWVAKVHNSVPMGGT
jgi:cobalamin biosynthesis Mg chelatase CobN